MIKLLPFLKKTISKLLKELFDKVQTLFKRNMACSQKLYIFIFFLRETFLNPRLQGTLQNIKTYFSNL